MLDYEFELVLARQNALKKEIEQHRLVQVKPGPDRNQLQGFWQEALSLSILWKSLLFATALLVLVSCGSAKLPAPKPQKVLGLLKVTVSGIGEGASPTATAQWVSSGVSGQAATVVPVSGSNALGDVQLTRRNVGFLDNDVAGTRNVTATFDLINRSLLSFDNLTFYAVNTPSSIGGTAIAAMSAGTGVAIADPAVARGFKPTHGMRGLVQGLEVNPNWADLQFFTPTEVDNPGTGIKQQAIANGILTAADTVLEYGFVARNYTGGRVIGGRDQPLDCTVNGCKGTVTLAYQFPKVSPRANNPFSFSLYFVVANETLQMGSQSVEEQGAGTAMGLTTFTGFNRLRSLGGSSFGMSEDGLDQVCRVKYAISPNLFLGPDPIPTTPGSLDVCFGAAGKRITSLGSNYDQAHSVAIQSDGKIVVAGETYNGSDEFALVRYNSNGSLDTSFGTGGKVITSIGASNDIAYAVALQSDGKIVVAGYSDTGPSYDFALARYNSDGSLDNSFSGDGKVTTAVGMSGDKAYVLAIQSDGKIVVAGESSNGLNWDFALARYNSDGSLDNSFSGDGKVTTAVGPDGDRAYSIALQSDGKIVAAGASYNGFNDDFALVRYNNNGSLDTSFSGDGKVTTTIGFNYDQANSLAIQSDGKIVLGGFSDSDFTPAFNYDFAVVRYNSNGSLDTSFSGDGKVITDFGSEDESASSVALQSDGKIVVVGNTQHDSGSYIGVARYNSDGSLDVSFDSDGKVINAIDSYANAVAIQSDGKIVVSGYSGLSGNKDFMVARYNP